MKDFSGTVVIIDPLNFAKESDLGKKIDLNLTRISPTLGFKTLFITNTGVDRCFITSHKVDNIKEFFQNGIESYVLNNVSEAWSGNIKPEFGRVSIDSGSIGVFLKEDIERYNPGCLDNLKSGEDYIYLENFKGKIGYTRDKYGMIHFYGTGSNNFYTI